jgi:hypothetical protein
MIGQVHIHSEGRDQDPPYQLFSDDEAGLLFPVRGADDAARAIRRLVDDVRLRGVLGATGFRRVGGFEPVGVIGRPAAQFGLNGGTVPGTPSRG